MIGRQRHIPDGEEAMNSSGEVATVSGRAGFGSRPILYCAGGLAVNFVEKQ